MSALYHNGHWYGGGQDIDIQSDPTATSFNPNDVPTGATCQSVLNSNLVLPKTSEFTYSGVASAVFSSSVCLVVIYGNFKGKTTSNMSLTSFKYYDTTTHDVTTSSSINSINDSQMVVQTTSTGAAGKYCTIKVAPT